MNGCYQCEQRVAQPQLVDVGINPVIDRALKSLAAMGYSAAHPLVASELQGALALSQQLAQAIELPPWDACLSVQVSIPPQCFALGQEVPITITVRSGGPGDVCRNRAAQGAGLDLAWVDPSKVQVTDPGGGTMVTELGIPKVRWNLGTLAPGQTVTRTVKVKPIAPFPCIGFDVCAWALNAPAACFPGIFCVATGGGGAGGGTNWLPWLLIGGGVAALGLLWLASRQEEQV